jgi:hypothetical protein
MPYKMLAILTPRPQTILRSVRLLTVPVPFQMALYNSIAATPPDQQRDGTAWGGFAATGWTAPLPED